MINDYLVCWLFNRKHFQILMKKPAKLCIIIFFTRVIGMPWLVNAAQLDKFRKSQKSFLILDASWHHPSDNRDAKQEFLNQHIVDAQFFDLTDFVDPTATVPNQLILDEKSISEKLSALGLRNDFKIFIYDNSSVHSACRVLWMLKMFGHNPNLLYILDGGFKAWENMGGKMIAGPAAVSSRQYTATIQPQYLRTLEQIKNNCHHPVEQIIDVRHPVRFCGGKEGRSGVRAGHIPGSFSFPYFTMLEKDGTLRTLDKIRRQMSDVSISLDHPIIASCGSGMTAPILSFVLDLMGHENHAVYDGSWSEWGAEKLYTGELSLNERPVETCLDYAMYVG